MHLEFLVEDESGAEAIKRLVPKIVGASASWDIHSFQGKQDLLNALPSRLDGYAKWLPIGYIIVVVMDRDENDCKKLKAALEKAALSKGLKTKTSVRKGADFQVLNRIVIEELEAWFFGDVEALVTAYPRIPNSLANKRGFRDPDAIAGGTWEALERVMKKAGYYQTGMPKIEVARKVSEHMQPDRNKSRCFCLFRDSLREILA